LEYPQIALGTEVLFHKQFCSKDFPAVFTEAIYPYFRLVEELGDKGLWFFLTQNIPLNKP